MQENQVLVDNVPLDRVQKGTKPTSDLPQLHWQRVAPVHQCLMMLVTSPRMVF